MQTNVFKKIFFNPFWLSILLHLLLLLFFINFYLNAKKEENKKHPNVFVPSYLYQAKSPTIQKQSAAKVRNTKAIKESVALKHQEEKSQNETFEAPKNSISRYVKSIQKNKTRLNNKSRPKSMLAATAAYLRESMHQSFTSDKDEDPIYLIGDNNAVSDPLIILLGKALSAHFAYPREAGEFGIRGRVIIKLTLHPEGYFSHVQMLQSSHNRDLDAAALYAVNSAPTVYGADRFITSPKIFVVGFIFR